MRQSATFSFVGIYSYLSTITAEAICGIFVALSSNPEMIHAVAGALKVCAEIWITAKALNVGGGQPEDLGLVG